jgi:hypothetical protein
VLARIAALDDPRIVHKDRKIHSIIQVHYSLGCPTSRRNPMQRTQQPGMTPPPTATSCAAETCIATPTATALNPPPARPKWDDFRSLVPEWSEWKTKCGNGMHTDYLTGSTRPH